jgi:hypothetical protein
MQCSGNVFQCFNFNVSMSFIFTAVLMQCSGNVGTGPVCCAVGGCVPQEANLTAIGEMALAHVTSVVPPDLTGNCALDWEGWVRCAFFDRNSHSRMPLAPKPASMKRAYV